MAGLAPSAAAANRAGVRAAATVRRPDRPAAARSPTAAAPPLLRSLPDGAVSRSAAIALQRLAGNRSVSTALAARAVVASRAPQPAPRPVAAPRPGRALRPEVRSVAESRFGWDFGDVRLHDDVASGERVRAAGAKAITTGDDIAVAGPTGDLEADRNRDLLHHELSHVVQQSRDRRQPVPGGLAERLTKVAEKPQPAPTVTAVAAGAELGAGRTMNVTATAAGNAPLTWTLVGAPAGVTIAPRGRRGAVIRSAPAALGTVPVGGGTNFQVQAALTATPADSAVSGNVLFVTVDSMVVNPVPAQIAVPIFGGGAQAAPANVLDPNRDGLTGNSGNVVVTTQPAGRPTTLRLRAASGASVAGLVITPTATTGRLRVRATDNATGTFNEDARHRIDSMPKKVNGIGPSGGMGAVAGAYGPLNPVRFSQTDNVAPSVRVIGETITAGGRDDFGLTPVINAPGGPNPAPIGALSAPANAWNDSLRTGHAGVDVNRFVGKNAPGGTLPAVWQLRQGFHAFGWDGTRAPVEFDNGLHIRSLIKQGNNFRFRTEHRFPGAGVVAPLEAYAAVNPLIVLNAITTAANAPAAAGGVAADGVATGNVTVNTTVAGRNVVWSVISGPIAIPGAAVPVGGPVVVTAGLVPGNYQVKVVDQALPNREGTGRVRIVPVTLRGLTAAPSPVPAGTLATNLALNAAPGGRTVVWTVDAAAAAAGVTVAGVAAAAPVATTAVLTRPAAFTGVVTVVAVDSVLANKRTTLRVRFL